MNQNDLFAAALGLAQPWKVIGSVLEEVGEKGRVLCVDLDFAKGSKFPCPVCGQESPVHDTEIKRWRHMNFWQHATYLSARVPRVKCPQDGVSQVETPWARSGSGFTLMFEALTMALIREMPVKAVSELLGEHDTRLWRIVDHYVEQAHGEQDWSEIKAVAIDETATRKGHRYATVVVDLDLEAKRPARLVFMTPERTSECVKEFAQAMPGHGALAEQIELAAIDMSPAYQKGVREHLPDAAIVFDRFHVMKLAGEAVDEVRKALCARGENMKGAMWALRGNPINLKEEYQKLRLELCARHKELARAMALKESLQDTWEYPGRVSAEYHLKDWYSWAVRSRLEPFRKLARTIKNHWQGILNFFPSRVTSAAIESINGIIQSARRRARGFRNFKNLRNICYWMAGDLDLHIPSPFSALI